MKKYIVLISLISSIGMAAPKPTCPPYVWGGPTPENCVLVTYPAPMGGTIDMADWMVMNAAYRGKLVMNPGYQVSHLINNKIIYTKFNDVGDFADIWTFDEDYIYLYATYGPTNNSEGWRGVRSNLQTDDPLLPRYAQLGLPGVRLVSEGGNFRVISDCVTGPVISSSNTITELWGPFALPSAAYLGDSGYYYVSMRSYWDCHGIEPESCTQLEDFWYMQPYGWINWTAYQALNRDGNFIKVGGGTLWGPVPGSSALPDWCLSPSLFATDPKPNQPITGMPFRPRMKRNNLTNEP